MSVDMLTNELVALRTDFIKIPDEIKGVKLEDAKKQILMEGKPLKLEGMISTKGTEFLAMDDVFRNMPDLKEEEEEWNRYGISGGDDSLAQGVTYDEPSSVGALFQNGKFGASPKGNGDYDSSKIAGCRIIQPAGKFHQRCFPKNCRAFG
ncbi:DUF3945 domain-containing protein [Pedobacter gandavensis]|nr:DUF3945 domain-containing protein [Pedobacter gandavensis]WGQ12603.1 DUF3945 domain-containing protein [Pedobacter gandavensis]